MARSRRDDTTDRSTLDVLWTLSEPALTDGSQHRLNVISKGGDVFQLAEDMPRQTVLWGELFKDPERDLLNSTLVTERVHLSFGKAYQLYVRTCWQQNVRAVLAERRDCRAVVLLHALEWGLDSSWSWGKFFCTLHRDAFSVVSPELPGVGRSSTVHANVNAPFAQWKSQDWMVVNCTLDQIGIGRPNLVAAGQSCATVIRFMRHAPNRVAGSVLFIDPVWSLSDLFEPPPGHKKMAQWCKVAPEKNLHTLKRTVMEHGCQLWVLFTKKHQRDTREAFESLTQLAEDCVVGRRVTLSQLGKSDICHAQIGTTVPDRFWYPCRKLKQTIKQFLKDNGASIEKPSYQAACGGFDDASTWASASSYRSWPATSSFASSLPPTIADSSTAPSTHRSHTGSVETSVSGGFGGSNGQSGMSSVNGSLIRGAGSRAGGMRNGIIVIPEAESVFELPSVGGRPLTATASAPQLGQAGAHTCSGRAYKTLAASKGGLLPHLRPATAQGEEGLYQGSPTMDPVAFDMPGCGSPDPTTHEELMAAGASKRAKHLLSMDPQSGRQLAMGIHQRKQLEKEEKRQFRVKRNLSKQMERFREQDLLLEELGDIEDALELSMWSYDQEAVERRDVHAAQKILVDASKEQKRSGASGAAKYELRKTLKAFFKSKER